MTPARMKPLLNARGLEDDAAPTRSQEGKHPVVLSFSERLRNIRAMRGMSRKAVAAASHLSERYLASLEHAQGNPSLIVLENLARALQCTTAELVGDTAATSSEWKLIHELLEGRSDADLSRARLALGQVFGTGGDQRNKSCRIALVGLRGAGKSTLGPLLAENLDLPFVELSREVENVAGYSVGEILALYGPVAYRRYERRALDSVLQTYPDTVIATPGGLVTDASNFNLLLSHCTTVWLQATPEDHMSRVALQGDLRPMLASQEAMDDLRRILAARSPFYAKATISLDTSAQPLPETMGRLIREVRSTIGRPADASTESAPPRSLAPQPSPSTARAAR